MTDAAANGAVEPILRLRGVGRRFGLTPWTARILFVLLLMVVPGSQILIYPVLWILMPAEENVPFQTPSAPPAGNA